MKKYNKDFGIGAAIFLNALCDTGPCHSSRVYNTSVLAPVVAGPHARAQAPRVQVAAHDCGTNLNLQFANSLIRWSALVGARCS